MKFSHGVRQDTGIHRAFIAQVPEQAHLDKDLHDARRCTCDVEQIALSENEADDGLKCGVLVVASHCQTTRMTKK